MEFNLLPQRFDITVSEEEGGGYYTWTATNSPAAVGAGKLVLQPGGLALPHYADTNKVGYVVQGSCTVGLVFPNKPEEKVIIINKGDAIPVAMGTISWWFNNGDSNLTIVFLGETGRSYTSGQFDYFFLTGSIGILGGFSTEFINSIYSLNDAQSKELVKSQSNALIAKIDADVHLPDKPNCNKEKYVINLDVFTSASVDSLLIDKIGLSPSLVRLEPATVLDPSYCTEHRIIYVTKGRCRIQIVGLKGRRVLDGILEEDQLIVVPRFFMVAMLGIEKEFEFFCVATSPRPLTGKIGGNTSAYKALSSSVLKDALNVSSEFVNAFKSKY